METTPLAKESSPPGSRERPPSLAAAERALDRGEVAVAAALLDGLRPGRDLDELRRLARAAAEAGRAELAAEALEAARGLAPAPEAMALLEAEHHVARGDFARARDALDAARRVGGGGRHAENIVLPGLIAVLDRFEPRGDADAAADSRARLDIPPAALWFEPVLTLLLFFLEREIERRPRDAAVHKARTTLFRPGFGPEHYPRPRRGILALLRGAVRGARHRDRMRREREVVLRLHEEDLEGAASALEKWLEEVKEPFGGPGLDDLRRLTLLDVLFALGRFEEVAALGRVDGGAEQSAGRVSALPLLAYADLACGRVELARGLVDEALGAVRSSIAPSADVAHLAALVRLGTGGPAQVLPWLRRAFRTSDIGAVELARREMELLGVGCAG